MCHLKWPWQLTSWFFIKSVQLMILKGYFCDILINLHAQLDWILAVGSSFHIFHWERNPLKPKNSFTYPKNRAGSRNSWLVVKIVTGFSSLGFLLKKNRSFRNYTVSQVLFCVCMWHEEKEVILSMSQVDKIKQWIESDLRQVVSYTQRTQSINRQWELKNVDGHTVLGWFTPFIARFTWRIKGRGKASYTQGLLESQK